MPDLVTIAGAAGAWGDSSLSTPQLLTDGRADYIIYEGLAEITMAILSRARARDPEQGYARDIIETIAANLDAYRAAGMKVITNAGGLNPAGAAALIRAADSSVHVGVVTGDDLTGSDLVPDGAISANVYLGARPIAAALDAGADVVVTGRVVDSALALGPLVHEFGWGPDDLDLLSAGSLAGHLIECGPQATGGLMTDWRATETWVNPGYPLAEVGSDGSVTITTPAESDGLVDERTVTEQLLYEIGDPTRYLLPDVTCDWSQVEVEDLGDNRVRVGGARGFPPPRSLKACAQIPDGWRVQSLLFVGGRDAVSKAERVGSDLLERGRRMLKGAGFEDFVQTDVEVLGGEATYGPHARTRDSREVVLKIAVHHRSREAVSAFVREIPSIALAGPPGVSGGGGGLPRPTPLIRLDCFPVHRGAVDVSVEVNGDTVGYEEAAVEGETPSIFTPAADAEGYDGETVALPLVAVAHGRSGDKGSDVNIGIRARHADFWPVLLRELTEGRVAKHLGHLGATSVTRFELPGIRAVNFLLREGLGAGGTASLRFDPQGKAIAQQLLDMEVPVPVAMTQHPALHAP